jgi:hypothetical protein
MPPTLDPALVTAVLEKATSAVILGWVVVAFCRGWIVPGSVYKAAQESIKDWTARHDRIASIAEATLRKAGGV